MAYIYTNSEGKMLNVSQTSYKLLNLTHGTVGRWRHFYRSKLVTLVHLPVTQKKMSRLVSCVQPTSQTCLSRSVGEEAQALLANRNSQQSDNLFNWSQLSQEQEVGIPAPVPGKAAPQPFHR